MNSNRLDPSKGNFLKIVILETFHIVNTVSVYIDSGQRIRWSVTISNTDLWRETNQIPPEDEIRRRGWRWIGHTLCKPTSRVTRQALCWNPHGKRKRGRPRNTWRRDHKVDIRKTGHSWSQLEMMAQNRDLWQTVVVGLCPRRSDGLR